MARQPPVQATPALQPLGGLQVAASRPSGVVVSHDTDSSRRPTDFEPTGGVVNFSQDEVNLP